MGREDSSSDLWGDTFEKNVLNTPECSDKNQRKFVFHFTGKS